MNNNKKALQRINEIANNKKYCKIELQVHEKKIKNIKTTTKEKVK